MGIEPTTRVMRAAGFEDQEGHQTPNASMIQYRRDVPVRDARSILADAGRGDAAAPSGRPAARLSYPPAGAISKPPDVCGSNSRLTRASSTPGAERDERAEVISVALRAAGADALAAPGPARPAAAARGRLRRARSRRTREHLGQMTHQAEAGHVGAGVGADRRTASRAARFSVRMEPGPLPRPRGARRPA